MHQISLAPMRTRLLRATTAQFQKQRALVLTGHSSSSSKSINIGSEKVDEAFGEDVESSGPAGLPSGHSGQDSRVYTFHIGECKSSVDAAVRGLAHVSSVAWIGPKMQVVAHTSQQEIISTIVEATDPAYRYLNHPVVNDHFR